MSYRSQPQLVTTGWVLSELLTDPHAHIHVSKDCHMCTHKYTLKTVHDVHPVTLSVDVMKSANKRIKPGCVKEQDF